MRTERGNWLENLTETEQKIKIEKWEVSLIYKIHAVYLLKMNHKFGSEFPSKQAKKEAGLIIISFNVKKEKQTSCSGEIIPLFGTENYENIFLCI